MPGNLPMAGIRGRRHRSCRVGRRRCSPGIDARPAATYSLVHCRAGLLRCGVVASDTVITRVAPGRLWHALVDDEVVGRAHALHRPDDRVFLAVDASREGTAERLLTEAIRDLPGPLFSTVDANDEAQLSLLARVGFVEQRREDEYLIPLDAALAATSGTPPADVAFISASDADPARLARVDDDLHQDVPGSDGWVNDVDEFREYTFDPRHFDPETYVVAVEESSGEYVGLARVWVDARPRLGLIGVTRPQRRRGLATALLHLAFQPLSRREVTQVSAEVDAENIASQTLLAGLGAEKSGSNIELRRVDDALEEDGECLVVPSSGAPPTDGRVRDLRETDQR